MESDTMETPLGSHVRDRDQPPLSADDRIVVQRFHELYYRRWLAGADTINLSFLGYETLKCPLDLWLYQELLVRTRPDVVVECGTYAGGSALYLAAMLDLIGHGSVMTIDPQPRPDRPEHPRITYLRGLSTAPETVAEVKRFAAGKRVMVILDSDHREANVYAELVTYAPLVRPGDYLIVEDTNVNGHPAYPYFGPGPMEAVERFLVENDTFSVDERCERFLMTLNPRGYLKRNDDEDRAR